ncbi:hypothetical protein [Deinococcus sp.]|uniref:hypothetical protein n=1 Tax=Deinococcus sp. TaxID=47478 RepID=UPI003B5B95B5
MRDYSLDAFKGVLVIGMILAHVWAFFGSPSTIMSLFHLESGITTFSGFLFAFGYATWFAYLSRDAEFARPRMLKTAGKMLIAFFISALIYRLIVDQAMLTPALLLRVLTASEIPPYSEFLLSFALVIGLGALAFKPLKALTERPAAFWALVAAGLIAGLFPLGSKIPQLGVLIGSADPTTFPIVQYGPWYLVGIWFAKHKVQLNLKTALIALACSGLFAVAYAVQKEIPSRFPPNTFWILGAAAPLWAYLWLMRLFTWRPGNVLVSMGENVRLYLLISNLVIFAVLAGRPALKLDIPAVGLTTLMIMLFCLFLTGIVRQSKTA